MDLVQICFCLFHYCCIYEWVFLLLGFDHDHLGWPSALISICFHHHELESL